jgi:hypothetical protein
VRGGMQGKRFSMYCTEFGWRRSPLSGRHLLRASTLQSSLFPGLDASLGRLAPMAGRLGSPNTGTGLASFVLGLGTPASHH